MLTQAAGPIQIHAAGHNCSWRNQHQITNNKTNFTDSSWGYNGCHQITCVTNCTYKVSGVLCELWLKGKKGENWNNYKGKFWDGGSWICAGNITYCTLWYVSESGAGNGETSKRLSLILEPVSKNFNPRRTGMCALKRGWGEALDYSETTTQFRNQFKFQVLKILLLQRWHFKYTYCIFNNRQWANDFPLVQRECSIRGISRNLTNLAMHICHPTKHKHKLFLNLSTVNKPAVK